MPDVNAHKNTILYNRHNKVALVEGNIAKTFATYSQLDLEIKFHDLFSRFFLVPEILKVSTQTNTIYYEFIKGATLRDRDILSAFSYSDLIALHDKIPKLKGTTRETILTVLFPKDIVDNSLVHGDFRLDNLLVNGKGDIYLIDFENSNYLFREFDDTYMYLSLLREDKDKAEKYYKHSSLNNQRERVLLSQLFYINGVLINAKIDVSQKAPWVLKEAEVINGLRSTSKAFEPKQR